MASLPCVRLFCFAFYVINHSIMSLVMRRFYVINRSASVFISVWDTTSNFVCTYSLASLISRLSGVFAFHEEGHVTC